MPPPIRELVADYCQRLVRLGGVELIEVAEAKREASGPVQRLHGLAQEAERIQRRLPSPATLIPLDAAGRNLSSLQLAEQLDLWRHQAGTVCFLIGGPDGLHPGLLQAAPWSLSLGAMTFPHMLARVLLLEQIYRAHTIVQRIPYHR
ncbi:MAG: 23S rRNA (pseudouridine(1915)-N(3))-methyltransferase RlmH [Magnetococcales bacterium]|nr:23S rRNA (pseudouridine(1915)-N(3))-methyltransferase RlmH [Magnetococcales bacterium]